MINSQVLAENIRETARSKKIAIGKMLSDCGLSVNTLSTMQSRGYFPRLEAIVKIADHLDVSVDCLLGRAGPSDGAENPATVKRPFEGLSEEEIIIIKSFRAADPEGRMRITQAALNAQDSADAKNKNAV